MHGTSAPIFSYSCSKGAFIGAALEGSVMMVRSAVNERFYGERREHVCVVWRSCVKDRICERGAELCLSRCCALPYPIAALPPSFAPAPTPSLPLPCPPPAGYCVSADQLLLQDCVPQPPAAATLYESLHGLVQK
jgi:hypothetical protein